MPARLPRKQWRGCATRTAVPGCSHPISTRPPRSLQVRNAVRVHSLILPGDRLALAYSGGPPSAALLHFLAQLRNPRTDRPARGKVR